MLAASASALGVGCGSEKPPGAPLFFDASLHLRDAGPLGDGEVSNADGGVPFDGGPQRLDDFFCDEAAGMTCLCGSVERACEGLRHVRVHDDAVCALHSDTSIVCWGQAALDIPRSTLAQGGHVRGSEGATDLALDDDRLCFSDAAGTLFCAQRGTLVPITTANPRGAFVAQTTLGQVRTFDVNGSLCVVGATGNVRCVAPDEARVISILDTAGATMIRVAGEDGCALLPGGGVRCWGPGVRDSVAAPGGLNERTSVIVAGITDAVELDVGGAFCARLSSGGVSCWPVIPDGSPPMTPTPTPLAPVEGVVGIAAGGILNCLRTAGGQVLCAGVDADGSLGRDGDPSIFAPVEGLTDVVDVDTRGTTVCALRSDGTGRCWGNASSGQVGDGSLVAALGPRTVYNVQSATRLGRGWKNAFAIGARGEVLAWGNDSTFRLLGDDLPEPNPTARRVFDLAGVRDMTGGSYFSCAVLEDGVPRCWGDNESGALGDDTAIDHLSPTPVVGLDGVIELAAGAGHTCARRGDGTVWCWGGNAAGQTGLPAGTATPRPTRVPGISSAIDIAAETDTSCAALADGSVSCWGNTLLQTFEGGPILTHQPHRIPAVVDATQVSVGGVHACARTSGGGVSCWGSSVALRFGELVGAGKYAAFTLPGVEGVTQVSAIYEATCVLRAAGTVSCFGLNHFGMLGDGTGLDSVNMREVGTLRDAVSLSGRWRVFCALRRNGRVACWGANELFQLGIGACEATPSFFDRPQVVSCN